MRYEKSNSSPYLLRQTVNKKSFREFDHLSFKAGEDN